MVDDRGVIADNRVLVSSGPRLAGIEGLRAIAASSIVVVHVWGASRVGGPLFGSGRVADAMSTLAAGVTLFFTLSGFLLYRPFARAITRGDALPSLGAYARNRALRIAPAYVVVIVIASLVLGTVSVRDSAGTLYLDRLTDPALLAQTTLLVQQYRPSTLMIGIGPAWSLAVEIAFYLVLPLLVLPTALLARRAAARRRRVGLVLVPPLLLLAIGLTGKVIARWFVTGATVYSGYNADWHSVIERSFLAQADLFAFGMLVAVVYAEAIDGRIRLPYRWRPWAVVLGLLVFLPCAATMHRAEHSYLFQNTGQALALALLLAAIVLPTSAGVARPPLRAVRVLESPAFVGVGLVSYSLFLWHLPVLFWLRDRGVLMEGVGGFVVDLIVVSAVAGTLSVLTYRFVERPALRRKRSMRDDSRNVSGSGPSGPTGPPRAADAPEPGLAIEPSPP